MPAFRSAGTCRSVSALLSAFVVLAAVAANELFLRELAAGESAAPPAAWEGTQQKVSALVAACQYDQAIETLSEFINANPNFGPAYERRAWVTLDWLDLQDEVSLIDVPLRRRLMPDPVSALGNIFPVSEARRGFLEERYYEKYAAPHDLKTVLQDLAACRKLMGDDFNGKPIEAFVAEFIGDLNRVKSIIGSRCADGTATPREFLVQSRMLRTLGDMDGALAAADVALKSQETRFQAASRKVNMLRVLKRTEDAAALVERWQKTGSRDPRLLFVRIGLAKDPEAILKDFQALSEMLPREPGFHFGLATRTMQMRKDVEASMIELDRAIEKGSRSLLPYYARCSLWVKKNDAKSALLDATTAVECNPYFNLSYELRSKVYAQLGDAQAAQRDERHAQWLLRLYDLHKKCRLNPENVEAGVALGDHYARGADWTPAVRVLSACLERDPKHANALRRRSQAYLTTGNLDAALADATALVAVSPEPGSYSVRGDVYAKRQDWDRAVQDYERAKSLDGRLEQALRKRAAWHTSKGRVEPAKADLERANQVSTAGFSTP